MKHGAAGSVKIINKRGGVAMKGVRKLLKVDGVEPSPEGQAIGAGTRTIQARKAAPVT